MNRVTRLGFDFTGNKQTFFFKKKSLSNNQDHGHYGEFFNRFKAWSFQDFLKIYKVERTIWDQIVVLSVLVVRFMWTIYLFLQKSSLLLLPYTHTHRWFVDNTKWLVGVENTAFCCCSTCPGVNGIFWEKPPPGLKPDDFFQPVKEWFTGRKKKEDIQIK